MKTALFAIFYCLINLSAQAEQILKRNTNISLLPCSDGEFSTNTPKTNEYLNKLKNQIANSNSNVFSGDLAAQNICIGSRYAEIAGRAFANARTRTIEFHSHLLLRARNDAQVAFVISHELAHITMRHGLDSQPVTGARESELNQIVRRIFDYDNGNTSVIRPPETRLSIVEILETAIENFLGQGTRRSWSETEAERVGSYFYLRSGFSSAELNWRVEQIQVLNSRGNDDGHAEAIPQTASERRTEALRSCGFEQNMTSAREPNRRGSSPSYANYCWTIWDLLKNAADSDETYKNLLENNSQGIINLNGSPTLAEVQEELRNIPNPYANIKPEVSPPTNITDPPKGASIESTEENEED